MDVTKQQLKDAAAQNIISEQQSDALYAFLKDRATNTATFTLTHILYYLGGLLAIGAMTLFMTMGWEAFGGAGIFWISLLYAGAGLKLTQLLAARDLQVPAGICATFVVCLVPLAIYGLQQWLGFWPDESVYRDYHRYIKWHWLFMELGTLAVGAIVVWHYKYPFLIMPIAATLWYMSMDITAMLAPDGMNWELRRLVSLYCGLVMIALAFWVDIRSRFRADYAFWIYLFGVMAFWGGLSAQFGSSGFSRMLYFGVNVGLILIGGAIIRRVFVVFGALGCFIALSQLAFYTFSDSWMFPIALTVLGFAIIGLGIVWQKYEKAISDRVRSVLPAPVRELIQNRAI